MNLKNSWYSGKKRRFIILVGISVLAAAAVSLASFTVIFFNPRTVKVSAENLMGGIKPQQVKAAELSEEFIRSTADFSLDLFKATITQGKNSLVSPASVYLALGMTASGAEGNTLKEFETLLGRYGIDINSLNSYYCTLSSKLSGVSSGKLSIANSIWYRKDNNLEVKKDFLKINADYYNASAYKADFNDPKTIEDINKWVKFETGNCIDKIINNIDKLTVMYLINAVYFEDKWKTPYKKEDIRKESFQLADGTKHAVDFMFSEEEWYLKGDKAEGFIKPYKNGKYSFVALLPSGNDGIESLITSLSGDSFVRLLKSKSKERVMAGLPKFKAEDSIELVEPLKKLGLLECFDDYKANFTKMGTSPSGNIYINDVLHKTFITVDEEGTKAAAVTKVEMQTMSAPSYKIITLDRPFVYAIVENETNLPLFLGTMMKPEIK